MIQFKLIPEKTKYHYCPCCSRKIYGSGPEVEYDFNGVIVGWVMLSLFLAWLLSIAFSFFGIELASYEAFTLFLVSVMFGCIAGLFVIVRFKEKWKNERDMNQTT